jgi:hypothetical protein
MIIYFQQFLSIQVKLSKYTLKLSYTHTHMHRHIQTQKLFVTKSHLQLY